VRPVARAFGADIDADSKMAGLRETTQVAWPIRPLLPVMTATFAMVSFPMNKLVERNRNADHDRSSATATQ
jgi:hypothetical protein